jgi:hypothetical protein
VSLEYFREEEAISWLERAIADSDEGEDVWVAAHVLLADVLAQTHGDSQRIVQAAKKALGCLPVADEWYGILQGYVDRFEQLEYARVVN